jgi:uncharacterized protein with beta-barrel porin domain
MTYFLDHQTRQMAAGRQQPQLLPARRLSLAYGDTAAAARSDPLAAYASVNKAPPSPPAVQRYRGWFEVYGSAANTGPQDTFTGDRRTTFGGIAGVGAAIVPDLNIGFTVDQSRTDVDVKVLPQGSRMDVTQLGVMLSANSGPWTYGVAGIHGFGETHSSRFDTGGEATAAYGMKMWGVIGEASYYWSKQDFRLVPKAGVEWTRVAADPYVEAGGAVPVAASGTVTERSRVYGALEIGQRTQTATQIYDASVYAKFIEIITQHVGALMVTPMAPGFAPAVTPGMLDARFEFATGTNFTAKVNSSLQLYAEYNGRFRSGYESHAGTLGASVRW